MDKHRESPLRIEGVTQCLALSMPETMHSRQGAGSAVAFARCCRRWMVGQWLWLLTLPAVVTADPCATVETLAPGVYVRVGQDAPVFEGRDVANIGFIVGDRCVAVIDSGGSAAEGRALDCAIRTATPLPVCHVIATHAHPDHILGHVAFRGDGVEFLGHQNVARDLSLVGPTYLSRAREAEGRDIGSDYLFPPTRVVDGELELDLGGRILQVRAHEPSHTTSDVSVLDSRSGVLWAGDLVFLRHVPVLAGSISGWLTTLDELERLPATRVVPGHGPVGGRWPQSLSDTRRYLSLLRSQIRNWIKSGKDLWQAQQQLGYSERDQWALFDHYHQRNIAHAFAQLEWEEE